MITPEQWAEAIADAKAVRLLALGWHEGQFFGHMTYVSHTSNDVERASCNCSICHQSMSLESSASHAQVCYEPKRTD